jgi:hypothetical protein
MPMLLVIVLGDPLKMGAGADHSEANDISAAKVDSDRRDARRVTANVSARSSSPIDPIR